MIAAYRWELAKLITQRRTLLAVLACVAGPVVLVVVVSRQSTLPVDTLFGRWVGESGFAVPLLVLGFAGLWALPALTSVVAGDLFAAEDRFGTWTTILTRDRGRRELFAGKTLAAATWTLVVVMVPALASTAAGVAVVGTAPLVGLTGQDIGPGDALPRVLLAWASVLPPALAFAALGILVSVATRNGPAGVGVPVLVGLGSSLVALADLPPLVRVLLPSTPFGAWHGLFTAQSQLTPLWWGTATSVGWTVTLCVAAYAVFVRREIGDS